MRDVSHLKVTRLLLLFFFGGGYFQSPTAKTPARILTQNTVQHKELPLGSQDRNLKFRHLFPEQRYIGPLLDFRISRP